MQQPPQPKQLGCRFSQVPIPCWGRTVVGRLLSSPVYLHLDDCAGALELGHFIYAAELDQAGDVLDLLHHGRVDIFLLQVLVPQAKEDDIEDLLERHLGIAAGARLSSVGYRFGAGECRAGPGRGGRVKVIYVVGLCRGVGPWRWSSLAAGQWRQGRWIAGERGGEGAESVAEAGRRG